MKIYEGNLEITKASAGDFLDLEVVTGSLSVQSDLQAPALTTVGSSLHVYSDLQAPVLTTVGGGLRVQSDLQAPALTTVGRDLYVRSDLQAPALTTVGRDLYVRSNLQAPALTTVGSDLSVYSDLQAPALTTVGGDLHVQSDLQAPALTTVGGDLSVCADFQAPALTTVGRDLYVCADFQAPALTTVGRDLYVRSDLQTPALTTVGRDLYVRSDFHAEWSSFTNKKLTWPLITPDGKHIIADGIMQEFVGRKGPVYRVRSITGGDLTYLVTDGHGRFAHGDTLKDARDSLIYKIGDRDTSKYHDMTKETVLTFAEAIEAYRVITGACEAGTKGFVNSVGKKDSYTIDEIIKITEGQYGNEEFSAFFRG